MFFQVQDKQGKAGRLLAQSKTSLYTVIYLDFPILSDIYIHNQKNHGTRK